MDSSSVTVGTARRRPEEGPWGVTHNLGLLWIGVKSKISS